MQSDNPYAVARLAIHTTEARVGSLRQIANNELLDSLSLSSSVLQEEISRYAASPRVADQAYILAMSWLS